MPRISVVVPIFNVEEFLDPCLASLAAQTFEDIDVVLVDDGSTDGSAAIAEAWSRKDERFRLVTQENAGLGAARNTGADASEGEYLAFVDSDDVLPPNAYELLLGALERTGSAFASGNVHRLTRFGATQSKFVARVFDQTRLKTHVTRFRPLLADRVAWNKLWRRSFWDEHRFRFPEGRLYEDIPVTLPAHFLAGSVDVLADTVYYWRIREGGELSITERRLEHRALLDRLASVAEVSERLERLGPRGAKRWYEESVVADDLRYYLNALDIADDAYRELFMDRVNAYLDRAHPRIYDSLSAIDRLKWYLVRKRLVPELVEVLQFEKQELVSTPPVQVRGKWYGDYPFRGDRRLRIPSSVYELRGELNLAAHIERLEPGGDGLRVGGYAFIHGIGAATEDAQTVTVSALRPGPLRRVRLITSAVKVRAQVRHRPDVTANVYQAARNIDWSGFEAVLDPRKLKGAGRWELYVTVRAGNTKRRRVKFFFPSALRAASLLPGTQAVITTEDGLTVEVTPQTATVSGGRVEGNAVELTGELLAAPKGNPVLEARRDGDGRRARGKLELAGRSFTARIELADGDGVWELSLLDGGQRSPSSLAGSGGRWRLDGREITLGRGPRGAVLTAALARPAVTRGAWLEGGRLELAGLADADVPWSDLVLANAVWDEEHAFPFDVVDGLAAVLTPAAVESLGGPRPLPAGTWELRMHVDGEREARPLAVASDLEAMLPLATVVDDKRFALELTAGGRLSVGVLQDLPDEERGRYHQRRQQRTSYSRARAGALTDTVVYSSFQGRQCSDSPLAIHRELVRRDAPLEHLWIVHDGRCRPPATATAVRTGSPAYYKALASARVVVTNDVLPAWFLRRPDQVCVQTGHGTPLKRLSFDHGEARRMNRRLAAAWRRQVANWQYVLSPNGFSTPLLRDAYDFEGELLETGYPRVDALAHADRAQAVRRRLGIPDGKRAILYAPTYRDQIADRDGRTRLDLRLDFARLQAALGSDTVLLFRKHHAVFDALPHAMWPYARDVSSYPDATELLLAADVLVTDYSSIAVDFANTGRPMVFYAYDLEQYESTIRGFNIDYEATVPGPVVRTMDELTEALRDPVVDGARYAAFCTRFCEHDDGRAAARVVDRLPPW